MSTPVRSILAVLATVAMSGCVGTAMTTDPGTGATVPVQGWRATPWYDDPAWRPFGSIGTKDWGQGPWWYGDPAWQFLAVGQGGRPELSKPGDITVHPSEATPAAAPPAADTPDKPSSN